MVTAPGLPDKQWPLFFPGIWLMRRLSYLQKFTLIGLLFMLPLGIALHQLIGHANLQLRTIENERTGLNYIKTLIPIFESVPQHRGMRNAWLRGDRSLGKRIAKKSTEIDRLISTMDALDTSLNNRLQTRSGWMRIHRDWEEIKSGTNRSTPAQSWDRHTELIARLIALILHVEVSSDILVDPNGETHYLITGVLEHLPQEIELTGQARGLGAGMAAASALTPDDRTNLVSLSSRIRLLLSETRQALLAFGGNANMNPELAILVRKHASSLDRFLARIDQELLQPDLISVQPMDYFKSGTLAIASALKILHAALHAGGDKLEAHAESQAEKKSLLELVSIMIMIIAGYLLVAFYLYVMDTAASLDTAARHMLAGDMEGLVTIEGRDELGQVVRSFNKIAAALATSSANLKAVVDYAADGIITIDGTGIIRSFNPAAEEIFGYAENETIGENVRMLMSEPYQAAHDRGLKRHIEGGASNLFGVSIEIEGRRRDGSLFPLDIAINDMYVGDTRLLIGTLRDITIRKQMEEEKQHLANAAEHSQRLESLGVLAGGIAHDFNNLLTAIMGNAALAGMKLDDGSPIKKRLAIIEESSQKAADLCRQMLAYSGKGQFEVKSADLSKLIREIAGLLDISISKRARIEYNLAEALPAIRIDIAQIQQVIVNLVTNASDAIGDGDGKISITTGSMDADAAYLDNCIIDEQLPAGRYVYLEVSDTGHGMDKETRSRIFEPFFTTKFVGRGLGLSALMGIVRGHQGAITLDSEPDNGTTFRVLLPSLATPVASRNRGWQSETPAWHGSGMVLVVDDEAITRDVAACILAEMGLTALTAADGQEGVDLYRQHANEIDVILLDMAMPRMSGEEVFREIRSINSDAAIILSSGYAEQDIMRDFTDEGSVGFLHKPYETEALADKLREAFSTNVVKNTQPSQAGLG